MMPLLGAPLALLSLVALPALATIYLLRQRARRVNVSSLALWHVLRPPREGGRSLKRLRTPLVFFLELLILLLLAMAAASPLLPRAQRLRTVMVVLDDSYSMQAVADGATARERAVAALRKHLRGGRQIVRLIVAGERPQMLGPAVTELERLGDALDAWGCLSPRADIEQAVALAKAVGGPDAYVLVLTDQPPDGPVEGGRILWRAVGAPRPNLAFVTATRSPGPDGDRCLFEVANLSPVSAHVAVSITDGTQEAVRELALAGEETRRFIYRPRARTAIVEARLGTDALQFDNRVALVPVALPRVRIQIAIASEKLRENVQRAIAASELQERSGPAPELVFTDGAGAGLQAPDTWVVRFHTEVTQEAFLGPFVTDTAHDVLSGVAFDGVVWGASRASVLPGTPLVLAGNQPLLSEVLSPSGRREFHFALDPDASTLAQSVSWPIMMHDLIALRARAKPAVTPPNSRLGQAVVLTTAVGASPAQLVTPDGHTRTVRVSGRRAELVPRRPGLHVLRHGEQEHTFAVNALDTVESDLSSCANHTAGSWTEPEALRRDYASIAWLALLLAAGGMVGHQALLRHGRE